MNAKLKAKELFDKHNEPIYPMAANLPKHITLHYCEVSVLLILEAIKTTTGHCELRKLDEQEVDSDIKFWLDVVKELYKL